MEPHEIGNEVYGYWHRPEGRKRRYWIFHEYAKLRTCQFCGVLGSSRMVQDRNDAACEELTESLTPVLCMACWNRFRVLIYEQKYINECWKLLNKLKAARLERKRETDGGGIA